MFERPTLNNLGLGPFLMAPPFFFSLEEYSRVACVHIFVHIYVGTSFNAHSISQGKDGRVLFITFILSKGFSEFIFYLIPFSPKEILGVCRFVCRRRKENSALYFFLFDFLKLFFSCFFHTVCSNWTRLRLCLFYGLNIVRIKVKKLL